MLLDEELSEKTIGAGIEIHRALGAGLLEAAYAACLAHELTLRGLAFKREAALPLIYKGIRLDCGYRMDFDVEERIVLEVKSAEKLAPIHEAQLFTYLRLSSRIGLMFNFDTPVLKNQIIRRVL